MHLCHSLSEAVWQCDSAKVQQLLDQGADPNGAHNGETPLLPAARLGSAECVGILLKAGADARWARSDGTTALHAACWAGGGGTGSEEQERSDFSANHGQCIQLLLEAGADIDAPLLRGVTPGVTPLHEAVASKRPAIVLALLAAGAAPDVASSKCETPLHLACRCGRACDTVPALLAPAALPNLGICPDSRFLHMSCRCRFAS